MATQNVSSGSASPSAAAPSAPAVSQPKFDLRDFFRPGMSILVEGQCLEGIKVKANDKGEAVASLNVQWMGGSAYLRVDLQDEDKVPPGSYVFIACEARSFKDSLYPGKGRVVFVRPL